ncbi:MAG: hypothetical protein MK207_00935 [Saprospiraceae bacterium]|nr:hypothetical protein [Saprospiraceae bacterium]
MQYIFVVFFSFISFGPLLFEFHSKVLSKESRSKLIGVCSYYRNIDSSNLPLPILKPQGSYIGIKNTIVEQQEYFYNKYRNAKTRINKEKIIAEASLYITTQLLNQIFPHWYGTKWSFDGYTSVPNKGKVGCSYFVSTTLLHAGFNLNRYSLAQQGPVSEAKSLLIKGTLLEIEIGYEFEKFIPAIKRKCKEGLYFIGLGHSHVGFLYYREKEVYFIQSSYGRSMQVEIDYANESDILTGFGEFTLVPITNNIPLIQKWVTGEEIIIVKGKD